MLAEEEFVRFAAVVDALLGPTTWALPTDCDAWDVRHVALHVLGSGDAQASFPEFVHQLLRGVPLNKEIDSHHWVDGMNELQIRERAHFSNAELVAQLAEVGPRAVQGPMADPVARALPPDPVRAARSAGRRSSTCSTSASPGTSGPTASTSAGATGRDVNPTADHDGRLVADIVGEWASIYGLPFELVLEGPAGGKFSQGTGGEGERVEIDAIEFIRVLSGRAPGTGVLSNPLPL